MDDQSSPRTWNNNSGANYTITTSSIPLSIEARGRYSKTLACADGACVTGEYLWLDTRVQNLDYTKSVWVELTHDGWQSSTRQYLSYEQPLSGGDERWGIDLQLCAWWYGSACT